MLMRADGAVLRPRARKRRLAWHREQKRLFSKKRVAGGPASRTTEESPDDRPFRMLASASHSRPRTATQRRHSRTRATPSRGLPRPIPLFARVSAQRPKRTTQFPDRLRQLLAVESVAAAALPPRGRFPFNLLFNLRPAGICVNVKPAPHRWRDGLGTRQGNSRRRCRLHAIHSVSEGRLRQV